MSIVIHFFIPAGGFIDMEDVVEVIRSIEERARHEDYGSSPSVFCATSVGA